MVGGYRALATVQSLASSQQDLEAPTVEVFLMDSPPVYTAEIGEGWGGLLREGEKKERDGGNANTKGDEQFYRYIHIQAWTLTHCMCNAV